MCEEVRRKKAIYKKGWNKRINGNEEKEIIGGRRLMANSWSQLSRMEHCRRLRPPPVTDLSCRIGCIKTTIAMRFHLNWVLNMQQLIP